MSAYLENYAEKEVGLLNDMPTFQAERVCVVPCYAETDSFVHRYLSTFEKRKTLLIVVINQPDTDSDVSEQLRLRKSIQDRSTFLWQTEGLMLLSVGGHHILLVDRFSTDEKRIPRKQGVGLARKVGTDLACKLIQMGMVSHDWIYSTDADAVLPIDYFDVHHEMELAAAVTFRFTHVCGANESNVSASEILQATKLYEQRLHYYVEGLRAAGSKYAFHTIGSCLAFKIDAYEKVRGFPKRAAGEDFYLLNKLAKIGPVKQHPAIIEIEARLSKRVPFGTGPAVADIVELLRSGQVYNVYHPDCFAVLKRLLLALKEAAADVHWDARLSDVERQFLDVSGFYRAYVKWTAQGLSESQMRHQIDGWFDAFRTLKFIHHCRDNLHSDLPLSQALIASNKK